MEIDKYIHKLEVRIKATVYKIKLHYYCYSNNGFTERLII